MVHSSKGGYAALLCTHLTCHLTLLVAKLPQGFVCRLPLYFQVLQTSEHHTSRCGHTFIDMQFLYMQPKVVLMLAISP